MFFVTVLFEGYFSYQKKRKNRITSKVVNIGAGTVEVLKFRPMILLLNYGYLFVGKKDGIFSCRKFQPVISNW